MNRDEADEVRRSGSPPLQACLPGLHPDVRDSLESLERLSLDLVGDIISDCLKDRRQLVKKHGYDLELILIMEDRRKRRLNPMTYKHITVKMNELSREWGIELHPHNLRRSYGYSLHKKGVPILRRN